jgi:outer membrane receptor protein involved in Fe transport
MLKAIKNMTSVLILAACTGGIPVLLHAEASAKPITIAAGELNTALESLVQQTGVQLLYDLRKVEGLRTDGVTGAQSAQEAVSALLKGTPLTMKTDASGAILITEPGRAAGIASQNAPEISPVQLAQSPPQPDATAEVAAETSSLAPKEQLEEIIVTAQKRAERLQDVPISIVAMTGDELQRRRITSLDELAFAVPGLTVQSTGTWQRRIVLRGISNFFGSSSSLIGLYLDEASVTSRADMQPFLGMYDLERVEVLRGPQGTLYGEGSVGGTIRFITNNPRLDRFTMNSNVAASFTQDGSPGQRLEGAVNVPLIENELGLRIAGSFDHTGGWIDQPAADRKDFNDQNLVNVRIKGLWQPMPELAVNAMAVLHRNDAAPSTGEDADGNFTQVFNFTTAPTVEDNYNLYSLTMSYDFAAARLLSATTYMDQSKDASNLGFSFQFTPPGTPRFAFYTSQFFKNRTLTEELRLTSSGSGPWQWTAGGFYRDVQFDGGSVGGSYFGLPGPPGTPLPDPLSFLTSISSKSTAVFGDTSYKLTQRFTLGAGLRYFEDKQDDIEGFGATATTQHGTFHSLNPRLYAQYKLSPQVNTYASAAKGFRSGGFNSLNQPAYDPEQVWTYELGAKSSLLQGRLSTDVAVFYSDYTDYQVLGQPLDPPVPITSNAGSARIKGIEWSLNWHPTSQWDLGLNGNYIDSQFYEINVASTSHAVGDPLDMSPKYTFTVSAQRDFKWNGKGGYARLDYEQNGRSVFRDRSTGPWYFSQSDIINLLNLNLSLQWSDNLSLGVFGQNLLDDRGFVGSQSIIQGSTSRSRPRTFGIGFGVTFD